MTELITASALVNIGGWTAFVSLLIWVFMRHQNGKWWTDNVVQLLLKEKEVRLSEKERQLERKDEVIDKLMTADRIKAEAIQDLIDNAELAASQNQTVIHLLSALDQKASERRQDVTSYPRLDRPSAPEHGG